MSARGAVRRGVVHLVVALVLGIAAAVAAPMLLTQWREHQLASETPPDLPPPSDRVQRVVDELRADGVSVTPDGRPLLDEKGERSLEQTIARHQKVPVYVLVRGGSPQLGLSPIDLTEQYERAFAGEDAVLFIWEGPQAGEIVTPGRDGSIEGFSSQSDLVGDPARTLAKAVRAAQDIHWYGVYEQEEFGTGAGLAVGGILGLLAAALFAGALASVRAATKGRRQLPGSWSWEEKR